MGNTGDHDPELRIVDADAAKGYALSGRIMLTAIVVLFGVVIFMVGLHLYARWYLVRLRRRQLETRRHRRMVSRSQIMMYLDSDGRNPNGTEAADRGLERPVLNSLPVFLYTAVAAEETAAECAVCLSEFGETEIVRVLPKCNHTFHLECIDMWFRSHSTCPLCRSPVEYVPEKTPAAAKESQPTAEPGSTSSGSGLCATCQTGEGGGETTSSGGRRKGEMRIDVPSARGFDSETELTPASRRLLSFKKILSMGRKSPAARGVGTSGDGGELDVESGLGETNRETGRV